MHHQLAVADPRPLGSHHLDHLELLLLDGAVVRLAERFVATHTLTESQRHALGEYQSDLDALIETLVGPAREYAEQVLALAKTVLDAECDTPAGAGGTATSAHRAA